MWQKFGQGPPAPPLISTKSKRTAVFFVRTSLTTTSWQSQSLWNRNPDKVEVSSGIDNDQASASKDGTHQSSHCIDSRSRQCRPSCGWGSENLNSQRLHRSGSGCTCNLFTSSCDNLPLTPFRMAEVGSLLARVKMATKVFAIFATNASFLRIISNFRI